MTTHLKAVEQCFTVVLFVFQFYPVCNFGKFTILDLTLSGVNPLRPNNDLSQTSHCNIKGVSVSEVMRIENKITPLKFY